MKALLDGGPYLSSDGLEGRKQGWTGVESATMWNPTALILRW